jgi:benzylsuccinate synthase
MTTCKACEFFNLVPKEADDYEAGKGDCVTAKADEKGKYWLSRPAYQDNAPCDHFSRLWRTNEHSGGGA